MNVAIVKYNAGNIYSVVNALRRMGIEPLLTDDAEKLKAALVADGVQYARVLVIQHAAEGLAVARSSPYLTDEDLALARAELLAMTEVE